MFTLYSKAYGSLGRSFDSNFVQEVIDQIQRHKLLFIETQDAAETSLALLNYIKVNRHIHNKIIGAERGMECEL